MASRQHFDTGETPASRHKDVFLEMKLMRIIKICMEMDKIYDSKQFGCFSGCQVNTSSCSKEHILSVCTSISHCEAAGFEGGDYESYWLVECDSM